MWLDFIKWIVASGSLVWAAFLINTGFKDRQLGMDEIKAYQFHLPIITDHSKVSERRLLAQFFSTVTPSKKLRKGWAEYLKLVQQDYDSLKQEKAMLEKDTAGAPYLDTRKLLKLADINRELTPTFDKALGITPISHPKFSITVDRAGEFRFNLTNEVGQIILVSEGYTTKAGCKNGIESVRRNAPLTAAYQTKTSSDGRYYFNLRSPNGQVIGTSIMYTTEAGRTGAIAVLKQVAVPALVDDQT